MAELALDRTKITTLDALRASGYVSRSVRQELRDNLIARIRAREPVFPGIVGFEETVEPQLQNAILSGQDIILLGERGQAKTRIIRSLTGLLDEWTPVLRDADIPEDPLAPTSARAREIVAEQGGEAAIDWLHRSARYGEKLATPDITIADLIGEVDPIKVAEGRYLADEHTIHYGLVPRSNRGVFAINELPDLAERIQVGLLNVMEERDVQIRGFKVRMDLDMLIVATANPEDYTNRGRIITPLKDRYGAQIRTHYPQTVEQEIAIMEAEAQSGGLDAFDVRVPGFMKEVVAELIRGARQSPDISQRSGVSVRASVACYESLMANAQRRVIRTGETEVVPRISDLIYVLPSLQGKVEFETMEDGQEETIMHRLLADAVRTVFDQHQRALNLDPVAAAFESGRSVDVSEARAAAEYAAVIEQIDGLDDAVSLMVPSNSAGHRAAAAEFILEGLHLNKKLNKLSLPGQSRYQG